ncbi:MAG: GGDEF domain-containing protein [Lachnospiraceae bacterium]|nr:GGDEF domain-containing protein [Lachnospiraceae bacterium]
MNFNLLHKAVQFITKDTGDENESPKLIVVMRIIAMSMLLYVTISCLIYINIMNPIIIALLLSSFMAFLAIVIMTYRAQTKTVVYAINICMVVWSAATLYICGWDVGVQQFITVILVLCFFSSYGKYKLKICYAIFLCAFRIFLYFSCRTRPSVAALDGNLPYILQILNSITIFWCISVIAYIFGKSSRDLDHKLVAYNTKLEDQANTDALTGLYNRRKGMSYLHEIIDSNKHDCISLCICDIDFFKKVNDNYGHDIGDVVLKQLAQTMKNTLKDISFIARWGGEEFLIVFPSYNGDESHILLGQLQNNIKAMEFHAGETSFKITMTFGLSEYDFNSSLDDNLKEADEKLYMGKENGRDQIVY